MADETLKRDQNHVTVLAGVTDDANQEIKMLRVDPSSKRLLVSAESAAGGTVTSVSVASANGFTGTVANATTTPAITMATPITGILKGNGTAISAVTVGTGLSYDGTTLSATGSSNMLLASKNWWYTSTNATYDQSYGKAEGTNISTTLTVENSSGFVDILSDGTDGLYAISTGTMFPVSYQDYIFEWCQSVGVKPTTGNDNPIWIFGTSTSSIYSLLSSTGFTDTGNSAFFKVEYDTDNFYLKAYSSNSLNESEETNIVSVARDSTTYFRLKIVVTEQTNIKFYVNGVLEATHTTKYPDDAGIAYTQMGYGISCGGALGNNERIVFGSMNAELKLP